MENKEEINKASGPQYTLLEPINNTKSIGSDDTAFSTYIQSTFNIIIGVLIVIGVFRIMYGGTIFLTTDVIMGKMKGKEVIIGSLKGVILALFTWSILSLINPDILNNNISKVVGGGVGGVLGNVSSIVTGKSTSNSDGPVGSGGYGSISCDSPSALIEKLNGGNNVCTGQTCSKVCNFTPDVTIIIKSEASKANIDPRIIMALACRESSANPNAVGNHANNGYSDCGLMQINMKGLNVGTSCTTEIMNVENNVREGIRLYKSKYNSISKTYNNVNKTSQAFASYNCCAGGDNPNDKSTSCDTSSGFAQSLPKWACPISPGNGSFNMCSVKNYACDVYSCINKY